MLFCFECNRKKRVGNKRLLFISELNQTGARLFPWLSLADPGIQLLTQVSGTVTVNTGIGCRAFSPNGFHISSHQSVTQEKQLSAMDKSANIGVPARRDK